ncbi:MAG: cdr [Ferruginibacter sp.]|uniref:FAD-dependent oxidoreductase n=1 Tax=Ferruginibacter sp. TaxID=1940288 RepID=UPI00265900C7|nr:FAD-dependent oxidoreductase [Ferruginibacter sp.]MDB5278265.1 cdr [Ferruginibacter sp.]
MQYIIIGGVAGGASTAARLRRLDEHASIILFEKGAYISYANCGLPYYIGDVITERNKLFVQTATSFKQRFNIDARVLSEVIAINAEMKFVTVKNLVTGQVYNEKYDKLVLSPGASPVRPPLPGINSKGIFTLRNVTDTDAIKAYVEQFSYGKALIIGAGFIGLEMAENLHRLGMQVTIVEMGDQVLAPTDFNIAAIAQQHIRSKGVGLKLKTAVTGFEQHDDGLTVLLKNQDPIEADVVILSIGVKPDTKLATDAGLQLGSAKGILVNDYLQTSDKDIYAVGDAIEFINPITRQSMPTYLAGPANKQGRICANNLVEGNHQRYHGSVNTAIVQLFDVTVGVAGVAAKHLAAAGIPHLVSVTHSGAHAGYYPDAEQMSIQITFSPTDGRLLGAQVIGKDGVDKRIDILSSVIQRGSTIYELAEFEHAYAPPYSSAKDPVNMAGFVAENILQKKLFVVPWTVANSLSEKDVLIDVRDANEFAEAHIPGAINIPVDDLRGRLDELDTDKAIYIYCHIGLRGYLAQRILLQNGFKELFNISGGFKLWSACNEEYVLLDHQLAAV